MVLLHIKERSRNGATPFKKNVLVMVLLHIKESSRNDATPYKKMFSKWCYSILKNVLVMVLLHIKERSRNGATRSECVLVMAVL